jgi:hypothetical protein
VLGQARQASAAAQDRKQYYPLVQPRDQRDGDVMSLRKRIEQVTLCSVKSCALYDVRPKSTRPIPESVLSYYEVSLGEYQSLELTPKEG